MAFLVGMGHNDPLRYRLLPVDEFCNIGECLRMRICVRLNVSSLLIVRLVTTPAHVICLVAATCAWREALLSSLFQSLTFMDDLMARHHWNKLNTSRGVQTQP